MLRLLLLQTVLLGAVGDAAADAATHVDASNITFLRNFKPQGSFGNFGQEASPVYLNGKLYLVQSIMGQPVPGQGAHSYFCVYDAETGEKVSCPASSSAFAFCSAIVDHSAPPQKLWVFCSAWDRANKTYCGNETTAGWGCGACTEARRGKGGGCYVASWSTEDLKTWDGPRAAVTLPITDGQPGQTVPNVAASMVPASAPPIHGVPKHQAFMALENGAHPIAINTGTDRDLSKNWKLLAGAGSPGLACPAARYNPLDKYYYVFGGGNDITLTRSTDLKVWEPRNMSMMTHCIAQKECLKYRPPCAKDAKRYDECCIGTLDCSPASGEGQIASDYFTQYWANLSDCRSCKTPGSPASCEFCRRSMLGNLSAWDWSVNDADFCDEGGKGPTRFIYGLCQQTRPLAARDEPSRGGGGYHVGIFPGNEFEWLSSFYPPSPGAALKIDDWLVDPPTTAVTVKHTTVSIGCVDAPALVMSKGLISRTFLASAVTNFATWSLEEGGEDTTVITVGGATNYAYKTGEPATTLWELWNGDKQGPSMISGSARSMERHSKLGSQGLQGPHT